MKQPILLIAMIMFAAASGFAHGNQQHVMGTVTAMTDNSIMVETKTKDHIMVYTMPDTKYENHGTAATFKDLKVGDRVVIHAAKMNDKLMATEVRFGSVARTPVK
jgi:hypothetical protein